jgi:hypothetical protein
MEEDDDNDNDNKGFLDNSTGARKRKIDSYT